MIWICILAVLAALFLGALYVFYRMSFYYRDPRLAPHVHRASAQDKALLDPLILDFENAPYQEVSILSHDGLTLRGQYYQASEGAPLLLQMHGYKGNCIRDFCGAWPVARDLGFNVLLVDQRAHGGSQGHTITFGIQEHLDCLSWAEYAAQRFENTPIFLMGVSMGAATVLMASGLNLPANVRGIIADCPYDSPKNIIRKVLAVEMRLPARLAYPLVRLSGRLFGSFDLEAASPLEAVQKAKVPILLIHGDADRLVPWEMSRALHRAAPEITALHIIPQAGHARNQVTDPALYRSILVPFLQSNLSAEDEL